MPYDSRRFFQSIFCPNVAITYCDQIDKNCSKFHLNFVQLLQPFTQFETEVKVTEPGGTHVYIEEFKLKLINLKDRPMSPAHGRLLLSQAVTSNTKYDVYSLEHIPFRFQVPKVCHWYEQWKDIFLKVQYPSDHEFLQHFLSCIFVISTSEENLFENLTNLVIKARSSMNHSQINSYPKWFDFNILECYVLIHFDNITVNEETALQYFEALKKYYGASNCYFINLVDNRPLDLSIDELSELYPKEIYETKDDSFADLAIENISTDSDELEEVVIGNSFTYHPLSTKLIDKNERSNYSKDEISSYFMSDVQDSLLVPGATLTHCNIKQLKTFVEHFVSRNFVPFIEKKIFEISECISNMKTVSRSFMSVTKRWFQQQKTTAQSQQLENQSLHVNDSLELQYRRLGDLYFLFRFYKLAFEAYYEAKKEFSSNQSWFYYAGALEMASIAAFMGGSATKRTADYLDESIITYLHTCKKPQFATRATIYNYECLRNINMIAEIASQLIRIVAANSESNLTSALLLEQAAYSYSRTTQPICFLRKAAFSFVRAGHHFLKSHQKLHALRCYEYASKIYKSNGWHFLEDHINFTIATISCQLKLFDKAVNFYFKLLSRNSFRDFAYDQLKILNNFFNCLKTVQNNSVPIPGPLPILKNPILIKLNPITTNSEKLEIPKSANRFINGDEEDVTDWKKLEESVFTYINNSLDDDKINFQSSLPYASEKIFDANNVNDDNRIIAAINEIILVKVLIFNPLSIDLKLSNLTLLYEYKIGNKTVSNSVKDFHDFVEMDLNYDKILKSESDTEIVFEIKPLKAGNLLLTGIRYNLIVININRSQEIFCINSKIGFQSIDVEFDDIYGFVDDYRIYYGNNSQLNFRIENIPRNLEVTFSKIHSEFYYNEIKQVHVFCRNTGTEDISNIYLATSYPLSLFSNNKSIIQLDDSSNIQKDVNCSVYNLMSVSLNNSTLTADDSIMFTLSLYSNKFGYDFIDLLIFYENDRKAFIKHRLIRHFWEIHSKPSLETHYSIYQNHYTKFTQEFHIYLTINNCLENQNLVINNIVIHGNKWKMRDAVLMTNPILSPLHSKSILMHMILFIGKSESTIKFSTELKPPLITHNELVTFQKNLENNDAIVFVNWSIEDSELEINGVSENVIHSFFEIIFAKIDAQKNFKNLELNEDNNDRLEKSTLQEELNDRFISYQMSFANRNYFDFKNTKSMLIVPIKIIFYNGCDTDVLLKVMLGGHSLKKTGEETSKQPLSNFYWTPYGVKFIDIESKTSKTFDTNAVFITPGIYDLSSQIKVFRYNPSTNTYRNLIYLENTKNCTPILIFQEI